MKSEKYKFKRFDLVAGVGMRMSCGESVSFIGIIDSCDNNIVTLSVVWSIENKPFESPQAWMLGEELEFDLNKSYCRNSDQFYRNIEPIGELSFPYDLPGHVPFVFFEEGRKKFEIAKRRGKISNRQQFQDLLAYVRFYGKKNISKAIIDFFNNEGWSDYANTFIQGVHKDGREWKEGKGKVSTLIYI